MSSPLEEILRKLEDLEQRIGRLEEAAGLHARAPANVVPLSPVRSQSESVGAAPVPPVTTPAPTVAVASSRPVVEPLPVSAAAQYPSPARPEAPRASPAVPRKLLMPTPGAEEVPLPTPDITQRLTPFETQGTTVHDPAAPLPDLSAIDEKLQVPRDPVKKFDTRAWIEDYPRICERILQLWGRPECEGYLNSLIIDTRGNRKGFPPGVVEELLYLGRLARALVIMKIDGDIWDNLDQVGDRR